MTVERVARTAAWRERFIAQHGARCHYCNRTGSLDEGPGQRPWHVDHMEPLARGGADDESNLTLACKRCNLTKNAWPYQRFVDLARAAFWQPDEGVSEGDLDALLTLWDFFDSDTEAIRVDLLSDGGCALVGFIPDEPSSGMAILTGRDFNRYSHTAQDAATFLVTAHRLVPDLVAEIRQHRAAADQLEDAS